MQVSKYKYYKYKTKHLNIYINKYKNMEIYKYKYL